MLETVFLAAQSLALIGWIPLFALPLVGRRRALLWARAVGVALCLIYLCFFLPHAAAIPRGAGYTLEAIGRAFDRRELLLAGWIHYLAFDLWVGAWEAEHAERHGMTHGVLAFCLFATMMIGPLGLLFYLAASWLRAKGVQATNMAAR
jgi:hypothetical protein